MDYDHLAVDLGNQIAEMLSREMVFSVWQKSLTEIVNGSMLDMKAIISENMQQSTRAFADAFLRIEPVDITSVAAACLNSVTEQLNSSVYQNMTSQWADALLKSIQALPIEEFETRQEIPAEEVQEALADVKSCLPEEAAKLVDAKVEGAQTADKKISNSDWIAIIGIIVTILLFIADQCSSVEHEQKEEAAWSAFAEYQQESIELQKQDIALKQEILDCLKNQNEVAAETQDASVNALEVAQDGFESAVDVTDLPDDSPEQETLDEASGTEN